MTGYLHSFLTNCKLGVFANLLFRKIIVESLDSTSTFFVNPKPIGTGSVYYNHPLLTVAHTSQLNLDYCNLLWQYVL